MGVIGAEARCWAENTRQLGHSFVGSPADGTTWYKLVSPRLPAPSLQLHRGLVSFQVKSVSFHPWKLFSFFFFFFFGPPAISPSPCRACFCFMQNHCRAVDLKVAPPTTLYFSFLSFARATFLSGFKLFNEYLFLCNNHLLFPEQPFRHNTTALGGTQPFMFYVCFMCVPRMWPVRVRLQSQPIFIPFIALHCHYTHRSVRCLMLNTKLKTHLILLSS